LLGALVVAIAVHFVIRVGGASVSLDRIEIEHVTLGEGLDLGKVEMDAGISLLWHGAPDHVTLHGAQVSADALSRLAKPTAGGGSSAAPSPSLSPPHLELDRCVIAVGDTRVTVSGTITASSIDLVAHSPQWQIGHILLTDVVATARDGERGVRTCVRGIVNEATVEACTNLPHSLSALGDLHALDIAMRVRSDAWTADGWGRVTWPDHGEVRALAWTAHDLRIAGLQLAEPTGTIDMTGAGAHTMAWTAIRGAGPLELGAGQLVLRDVPIGIGVARLEVQAMGGLLDAQPFTTQLHFPIDLAVSAHGIELGRVLEALAKGHVEGKGVLDGQLALRLAETGPELERAEVHARGRGTIRVGDPDWRAKIAKTTDVLDLQRRIANALTDFEYSDLSAVLGPPGSSAELRITSHGRGRKVAQRVELIVNVRGVREAAHQVAVQP
jgi:hypothetical protein